LIPRDCKRLAEVDFPIALVSRHAASEKTGARGGHPSTLHVWWARRPLGSSRAMLLALLLPDPIDAHCPPRFKEKARELLSPVQGVVGMEDGDLRRALLKFIGEFANWSLTADATCLAIARGLVKAAHPGDDPVIVDSFAGGGSIPLEALRIGCDVFASDVNPVACMILKAMLEDIPKRGPELTDQVKRAAVELKAKVEGGLRQFYPNDSNGTQPIAYVWARTVRCDDCGSEIPLISSWWLMKQRKRKRALRYRVVRPNEGYPRIELEIFEPKNDSDVPSGTVNRAKARCLCCSSVMASDRVRAQITAVHGGADPTFGENGQRTGGALLLAVVTRKAGETTRSYRLATPGDYEAVRTAIERVKVISRDSGQTRLPAVPDEPTPVGGGRGAGRAFSVHGYGMVSFGDLFTARQKLTMVALSQEIAKSAGTDQAADQDHVVSEVLALALNVFARSFNIGARLRPDSSVAPAFGMQTMPVAWSFPETVPWGTRAEHFDGSLGTVVDVLEGRSLTSLSRKGQVELADATALPLPDGSCSVWFTDPPYYDAVPYADLSDFFYVWFKRSLPGHKLLVNPFERGSPVTPKSPEIVQDEVKRTPDGRPKDKQFFEGAMQRAFSEGRRVLQDDGVACIVFAHKTTEGWEALLSGMISAGWTITGSWPVATESASRLRARESAALATSVHLVCRPRTSDETGDWVTVRRELPKRVGEWMSRLQEEGVRGADLVFACIGPALEIYSRYARVVDANDRDIPLGGDAEAVEPHRRGYLAYVWEVVGRSALEQVLGQAEATAKNGAAGAVEEDARLTALFLWTLQSTAGITNGSVDATKDEEDEEDEEATKAAKKGLTLPYDVVRRFAQPLGIHLDRWENRIVDQDRGVVRLLPVSERAEQLFGEDGAQAVALELERSPAGRAQMTLFPDAEAAPRPKRQKGKPGALSQENPSGRNEATTLDRVHAAMLLQRAGKTQALRRLLAAEQERGPDFLRLANALSALYPSGSEEERLLDAMLLAVPR